jgi:hypothetical protein
MQQLVFESANFMASFPYLNETANGGAGLYP